MLRTTPGTGVEVKAQGSQPGSGGSLRGWGSPKGTQPLLLRCPHSPGSVWAAPLHGPLQLQSVRLAHQAGVQGERPGVLVCGSGSGGIDGVGSVLQDPPLSWRGCRGHWQTPTQLARAGVAQGGRPSPWLWRPLSHLLCSRHMCLDETVPDTRFTAT